MAEVSVVVGPDGLHVEYLGKGYQDQNDLDKNRRNIFEDLGNDWAQKPKRVKYWEIDVAFDRGLEHCPAVQMNYCIAMGVAY